MRHDFTGNNRSFRETFEIGGYQVLTVRNMVPKVVICALLDATFRNPKGTAFFTLRKRAEVTESPFCRFSHFAQSRALQAWSRPLYAAFRTFVTFFRIPAIPAIRN